MTIQQNEQKALLKAISTVMTLDDSRVRGALDAEGLRYLADAEDILAGSSGRKVLAAFLSWNHQGQLKNDPRREKVIETEIPDQNFHTKSGRFLISERQRR